jgi:hypothetical protein
MGRSSAQPFVWVGVVALIVAGTVVALQFVDSAPVSDTRVASTRDATVADETAPRVRDAAPVRVVRAVQLDAAMRPDAAQLQIPSSRGLELFREQAFEDVRRLGSDAADMEQLWKVGRFTGNTPEASRALQALVDKYGDTHRASCARYLLQRNALTQGEGPLEQRRASAAESLTSLIGSDPDTRCDTGARASQLAKFLLATQVYRHTDFERSVELLREVAEAEADEVDNLGTPLALRARTILKDVEASGR